MRTTHPVCFIWETFVSHAHSSNFTPFWCSSYFSMLELLFLSQRYTLLPRRAHLKHVAFENTYLWWQVDLSVIHSCCTFSFMPGLRSFYSTCFSVLWCPLNTKWLGLGGRKARSLKDQGLKQKEMLSQAFVFVLSTLFSSCTVLLSVHRVDGA